MEDFLKKLGIVGNLTDEKDGSKSIDLGNYDNYGKTYSKLDKSNLVEEEPDDSTDMDNLRYVGEGYSIQLLADYDDDNYKLIIKEN